MTLREQSLFLYILNQHSVHLQMLHMLIFFGTQMESPRKLRILLKLNCQFLL